MEIWFDTMLSTGDIKGLQKSSMALSRLGSRTYKTWAIANLFLAFKYGDISDMEKKLFPKLAAGMVKTIEPLQTAQEGYLKALIFQINEDNEGLLEFLSSKQVRDWDLLDLNIMLCETLDKLEDWERLKTQCIRILKELNRDDFNHWRALIKACIKLDQCDFVRQFISEYKAGQNSKLATVFLAAEIDLKDLTLNAAAEQYFDFMGSKRSTFNDLQPYTLSPKFDKAQWLKYLEGVEAQKNDQNLFVNIEKFRFLLRDDKYDLNALVKKQVELYMNAKPALKKKDAKDYHSADDHILVAAYAVLEQGKGSRESLLQAAILLETACIRDSHQFYVRLWLVRIYLLLGAMTKAHIHFKVLRVQRLQVESMAPYIMTRAMSLFPSVDPLRSTLDTYGTFDKELKHGLNLVYEKGTYTQLESFINLRHSVENSLTRGILSVQTSQLSRFQVLKKGDQIESTISTKEYVDNRDLDIMFDLPREGEQKLSHVLTLGPKVGSDWVKVHELKHEMVRYLVSGGDKLGDLLVSLESLLAEANTKKELTESEAWAANVIVHLAKSARDKQSDAGYQSVYSAFSNLKLSEAVRDWKTIHKFMVALETFTIISTYVHTLNTKRNQLHFSHDGARTLSENLLAEMEKVKHLAGDLKDKRPQQTRDDVNQLNAFCKEVGLENVFVEDIVDGIFASQDQALTLVRTKIIKA